MSTTGNCNNCGHYGHYGYTLLELLAVLALISLAALFSAPRFTGMMQAGALKIYAGKTGALVREAAYLARRDQRGYELSYDASLHAFTLKSTVRPAQDQGARKRDEFMRTLALPKEISLVAIQSFPEQSGQSTRNSRPENTLYINARGCAAPARITLVASKKERLTLHIAPYLSQIVLQTGPE